MPQCLARSLVCGDGGIAVEPDEPLRGREEDHRIVAAPAMRVLMRKIRSMQQTAALFECLLDAGVGVEHALSGKELHALEEMATRSNRRIDVETIPLPGEEVVGAVTRRSVNGAGTRVERDVVCENRDRIPSVQRMAESDVLELCPFHPGKWGTKRETRRFRNARRQRFGHHDRTPVDVVCRVIEI